MIIFLAYPILIALVIIMSYDYDGDNNYTKFLNGERTSVTTKKHVISSTSKHFDNDNHRLANFNLLPCLYISKRH